MRINMVLSSENGFILRALRNVSDKQNYDNVISHLLDSLLELEKLKGKNEHTERIKKYRKMGE